MLDERGRFWNDGVLIEHAGATRAFASWLDLHPDDGRFILTNGYDWTYLEVVDAPFIVTHVQVHPEGGALLTLSDGSEEPLDPTSVCIGRSAAAGGAEGGHAPSADADPHADAGAADAQVLYARVKDGRFEARFSARAQAQTVELLVEGPDAAPMLQVAGGLHGIGERRPRR